MKNNNIFRRVVALLISVIFVFTMLGAVSVSATDTVTEITFGSVTGIEGEEVIMPIVIQNNRGIATYRFRISYDSEQLEFISVQSSDAFSSGTLASDVNPDTNSVTFLWYSITDVAANGEMAFLKFKVADDFCGELPIEVIYRAQDLLNQEGQMVPYTVNSGAIIVPIFSGMVMGYNKPLANATIRLLKDGVAKYSGVTSDGKFKFDFVSPDKYVVEISSPGYVTKNFEILIGNSSIQETYNLLRVGDASGDGNLNNQDLATLMQYINGWNVTFDSDAADVNNDGMINNKDYVLLMRYINGWDVVLK